MGNDSCMNRRTFAGILGAAALSAAIPTFAVADETAEADAAHDGGFAFAEGEYLMTHENEYARTQAELGPITEDLERFRERGGSTMTVEELNKVRRELVDAAEGFDKPDGTHVDAVWHKLAVLTNTYGFGGPDPEPDGCDFLMCFFGNDEQSAQDYIDMPWGKIFTPDEYAEVSGKSIEDAKAICADLAQRGLLYHMRYGAGDDRYHHIPLAHGFYEHAVKDMWDPDLMAACATGFMLNETVPVQPNGGAPMYYAIPCSEEVVADERVLPCNDWRQVVDRHEKFVVLPCVCSLSKDALFLGTDALPAPNSPEMAEFRNTPLFDEHEFLVEKCIGMGEQAEFYLEMGFGREITKEECVAIIERNIADGLILQVGYERNPNIICSCHSDHCGVLGNYIAMGPEAMAQYPTIHSASNYLLEYDAEACIQCGMCAQRCPMRAVSMDSGIPEITGICVRCGQCGLTCPMGARKLTVRPANDRLPIPDDHMADHNRKFGWRLEHGLA